MPGADAVSGALALDVEVEPEVELEPVTGVELGLEEQAATASAAAATTATAGARSRFDLFIEYLPFLYVVPARGEWGGREPPHAGEQLAPLRVGGASLVGGRRIVGRSQGVGDVGRAPGAA